MNEMRKEYDFRGGIRSKYAARVREGSNVVVLDADVAVAFPNSSAVNRGLRALLEIVPRPLRRRTRKACRLRASSGCGRAASPQLMRPHCPSPKLRHHILRKPLQLVLEVGGAGAEREAQNNLLEAWILALDVLEVVGHLGGRGGGPGPLRPDVLVVDASGDVAGDARRAEVLHLVLAVAQHAERRRELHVLLEDGLELALGLLVRVAEIAPQPERHVLAELQRPAVAGVGLLVRAD